MSDPVSQSPKIRIRGLSKAFGSKTVLDGIDLDVMPRTSMVIIGGSGSGKSVLLRCILGLIEPDSGSIEIDGENILTASRARREVLRRQIGMLFQNAALFDSMSVADNIGFGLRAKHHPGSGPKPSKSQARTLAEPLLEQVGLAPSIGALAPSELSGGMQKRVGLARAIAGRPDILFFDEPTTGLDPIMGAVIDGLIVDCVQKLGSTAIAITHDMASAQRIGTDAAMLYQGKLVWKGKATELMNSGNAMVDQFTHGRREGPINMEPRK
ncbi:ABC transporter ATP-binding protein [Neokomagataea anthophila]|uniref:ATP-binding cassette domain-containing protein n=1 Tax=Neokomagataea anthophila TaxID=2826925 RepID=A0ABS5E8G0_9PROT|nr:ATP-binding cassette domain-containing protein [Neokomagataea anthophila]MBR0560192.1 ATP-binding cassette domain-containing protein [Neokomagataea anthophila]